ncbi:MAG: hypothetical protein AB1696_22890 [Planctomycetota bacterium]
MNEKSNKKPYAKPTIATEKVFEQAALSCVVRNVGPQTSLKSGTVESGCGFTSS